MQFLNIERKLQRQAKLHCIKERKDISPNPLRDTPPYPRSPIKVELTVLFLFGWVLFCVSFHFFPYQRAPDADAVEQHIKLFKFHTFVLAIKRLKTNRHREMR